MVAYTVSMDVAEHSAPGYHLPAVQEVMTSVKDTVTGIAGYGRYSPGYDDLKKIAVMVEAIGEFARMDDLHVYVLQQLLFALLPVAAVDRCSHPFVDDHWMCMHWPPLLQLPLADVAVLLMSLASINAEVIAKKEMGELPSSLVNSSSLVQAVPWVVLARLVQLCSHLSAGTSAGVATVRSWGVLAPLQDCLRGAGVNISSISDQSWRGVLHEWVVFMRTVAHLSLRMSANSLKTCYLEALTRDKHRHLVMPVSAETVTVEMVAAHMAALNMSFLLANDPLEMSEVGDIVHRWTADRKLYVEATSGAEAMRFDSARCGRYQVYPTLRQPRLIAIPHDYTKLHASVMSLCPYDMPAICLVCGAILNGGGQAQCHMHSLKCGEGVSVFFLVQVGYE